MKLALLGAWIVCGAALLFVHLFMVWRVLGGPLSARWRYFGVFVPIATPVVAWRGGNRIVPILWSILLVGYVALRFWEV